MLVDETGDLHTVVDDFKSPWVSQSYKILFSEPQSKPINSSCLEPSQIDKSDDRNARWGREHDKKLFQVIRTLESEGVLTLSEIVSADKSMTQDFQRKYLVGC